MRAKRENSVERWVERLKPGSVFSACDLPPSISRGMRDVMLSNLAKAGKIVRLMRGIYGIPVFSTLLGEKVSPGIEEVVQAIARKYNWHIMPSDDAAANGIGLTTQVPVRMVYVSDGPTRRFVINGMDVEFRHHCQRETNMSDRNARIVVRGLRGMGPAYITPEIVRQVAARYSDKEWRSICEVASKASGWITKALWSEMRRRESANEK